MLEYIALVGQGRALGWPQLLRLHIAAYWMMSGFLRPDFERAFHWRATLLVALMCRSTLVTLLYTERGMRPCLAMPLLLLVGITRSRARKGGMCSRAITPLAHF